MNTTYQPKPGDHIKVRRKYYSHHGIYVGNDQVVHYSGEVKDHRHARVSLVSLEDFLEGGVLCLVTYPRPAYPPEAIVARAKSRLGENEYNLVFGNCEHYATWCVTGKNESKQVKRSIKGALASAGVVLLVAGQVVAKLVRRGRA